MAEIAILVLVDSSCILRQIFELRQPLDFVLVGKKEPAKCERAVNRF
jgi:hypothetical protein